MTESVRTRVSRIQPLVDEFKSSVVASRYTIIRREAGRDGKILRDHSQDGNVAVGGIVNTPSQEGRADCLGKVI